MDDYTAYINLLLDEPNPVEFSAPYNGRPQTPFLDVLGLQTPVSDPPNYQRFNNAGASDNVDFINQYVLSPPPRVTPAASAVGSSSPQPWRSSSQTSKTVFADNFSHVQGVSSPLQAMSSSAVSPDLSFLGGNYQPLDDASCKDLRPNWPAITAFLAGEVRQDPGGNRVFHCSVCGAQFSNGHSLGGHMSAHRKDSKTKPPKPSARRGFKRAGKIIRTLGGLLPDI